ncbi:MAG: transposase [Clostridia bacterium]|nr:transposase [Clostridia bacterium]
MFRGHNKNEIFLANRDYQKFLELLQELKEKKMFEIYAFCLMTNHVHLVIKESVPREISDIMKRLIGSYTQWFNYKYGKSGSLTESRYKSRTVETDEYFLHLIRYIHQNPIKAGIVEKINEYKWSSYENYLADNPGLVNTEFLLEILPKHSYEEFHMENENNEFTLYHDDRVNTTEIMMAIKSMGIKDADELRYMREERRDVVIRKLKEDFSLRQIERVTGISRYKIKNI